MCSNTVMSRFHHTWQVKIIWLRLGGQESIDEDVKRFLRVLTTTETEVVFDMA